MSFSREGMIYMWTVFISMLLTLKPILFLVSYISSTTSFPQPLTAEEESMYLERYEQGDEEARNILVERNLRLVAHIVKKYSNIGRDMDDLISIGTIGLIKGITTFDRSKGTRLATYAARCIENEILMTIRSNKKIKTEVSLQDPIGVDKEGNELPSTGYQLLRVCFGSFGNRRREKSSFRLDLSLK